MPENTTPYWFTRMGGKQYLKKRIIPLIPRLGVKTYVEPFVGSGKVLLGMEKFPKEVVNDLDKDVYVMWKGIRSVPLETFKKMDFTPSRDKFKRLKESKPSSLTQKLHRALYLNHLSFEGNMDSFGDNPTTFKTAANWFKRMQKDLPAIQERLKPMTILNTDWKQVVRKYDSPSTFFYVDPPYYEVEGYGLPDVPPEELYDVLSKTKGQWIMSYNDVPIIRKLFKDYTIKRVTTRYSFGEKQEKTPEVLIMKLHKSNS